MDKTTSQTIVQIAALGAMLFSLVALGTIGHFFPKISMVRAADLEYAADFSSDAVLVGASHNVFVGKVIRQLGSKERGIGPETQFQVQIIDNIKGDLKGVVTVDQIGGYKNGVLYTVSEDAGSPKGDSAYLLQPGSTYLLATRYNRTEDWYTLNPFPTARKLISRDQIASTAQLRAVAEKDARFKQLEIAYPREVLLNADVVHGNALNRYNVAPKPQSASSSKPIAPAPGSGVTLPRK
jgi:hypothetical protein